MPISKQHIAAAFTAGVVILAGALGIRWWVVGVRTMPSAITLQDMQLQWERLQVGSYRLTVYVGGASRKRELLRTVQGWWDADKDVMRVEEYDAQGDLYWVLLRHKGMVTIVDVHQRTAQQIKMPVPPTSHFIATLHPYASLWRSSLPSIQQLARDPMSRSSFTLLRRGEQSRFTPPRLVITWSFTDGSGTAQAEFDADTLAPQRCVITYYNGKQVEYNYALSLGAPVPTSAYVLPSYTQFESYVLERAEDLGESVQVRLPTIPAAAAEGPGEPDRYSLGRADWMSLRDDVQRFTSLPDALRRTGMSIPVLPERWLPPKEIWFVKDRIPADLSAVSYLRLLFHDMSVGDFRLEIRQFPQAYQVAATEEWERLAKYSFITRQLGGKRVAIYRFSDRGQFVWSGSWFEERSNQLLTLEYVGEEGAFMQLLQEVVSDK